MIGTLTELDGDLTVAGPTETRTIDCNPATSSITMNKPIGM